MIGSSVSDAASFHSAAPIAMIALTGGAKTMIPALDIIIGYMMIGDAVAVFTVQTLIVLASSFTGLLLLITSICRFGIQIWKSRG